MNWREYKWLRVVRLGGLLVFGLSTTSLLAPDAFSQAPSEAGGAGRIGDLVGIWDCKNPETQRSLRIVEFRGDGTSEITNAQGGKDFVGKYEQRSGCIFFRIGIPPNSTAAHPSLTGLGIDLATVEKGRILQWIDGDLFRYQVEGGTAVGPYGKRQMGEQLEFHRLGSSKTSVKEGSLVGTWQEFDTANQSLYQTIKLNADGTYEIKNERKVFVEPTEFYAYHDGILSFFFRAIGYPERRMERGVVEWSDENRFTLKLLDGDAVGSRRGKVYEFRRQ
jgi:hypothetical protein